MNTARKGWVYIDYKESEARNECKKGRKVDDRSDVGLRIRQ